ncbi:MAG: lipoyl(octanoyl) transferase LipB [Gammaproteobacteria bacterium]|nr:lipoyl(octanoyl) transferase LipB [Gammaproteobacteria bacterium]
MSPSTTSRQLKIRRLGNDIPYQPTYRAMQQFTAARDETTIDEIWLLQHPPTYTQGINSQPEHLLNPEHIPVIDIDRGGQVTYHGPGQWVLYLLLDMRRLGFGVRELVSRIEQSVIALLKQFDIDSEALSDAPGVYVEGAKIAALGLKIKRGFCYHGLSLNVAMDLTPFEGINPCGYRGLRVTDMAQLGITQNHREIAELLIKLLAQELGYTAVMDGENRLPLFDSESSPSYCSPS